MHCVLGPRISSCTDLSGVEAASSRQQQTCRCTASSWELPQVSRTPPCSSTRGWSTHPQADGLLPDMARVGCQAETALGARQGQACRIPAELVQQQRLAPLPCQLPAGRAGHVIPGGQRVQTVLTPTSEVAAEPVKGAASCVCLGRHTPLQGCRVQVAAASVAGRQHQGSPAITPQYPAPGMGMVGTASTCAHLVAEHTWMASHRPPQQLCSPGQPCPARPRCLQHCLRPMAAHAVRPVGQVGPAAKQAMPASCPPPWASQHAQARLLLAWQGWQTARCCHRLGCSGQLVQAHARQAVPDRPVG